MSKKLEYTEDQLFKMIASNDKSFIQQSTQEIVMVIGLKEIRFKYNSKTNTYITKY